MLNANFTTIQDIRRNYKEIVDEVNETNLPTVVISNNRPQFVIVSIKMLSDFQKLTIQKTAKGLVQLAQWAEKVHAKGPKDLSQNLDKYLWE